MLSSPRSPSLERVSKELNKEIDRMEKELKAIEDDNKAKQIQFEREQYQLAQQKAEIAAQQRKLNNLKKGLNISENRLSGSKKEIGKKFRDLDMLMHSFRKVTDKRNNQLIKGLQNLDRLQITDKNHYGDMQKYKQEIQKKISEAKSRNALSNEEKRQKCEELAALQKQVNNVDHPEIGPELKQEITENCNESLRCKRKKLVDVKMANHGLKCKLGNMGEQH